MLCPECARCRDVLQDFESDFCFEGRVRDAKGQIGQVSVLSSMPWKSNRVAIAESEEISLKSNVP